MADFPQEAPPPLCKGRAEPEVAAVGGEGGGGGCAGEGGGVRAREVGAGEDGHGEARRGAERPRRTPVVGWNHGAFHSTQRPDILRWFSMCVYEHAG
eukprot:5970091-Alexandrium_andersonii.AAC.1